MILIAGPCVIENKELLFETVECILSSIKNLDIEFYFKASCVKDNRTKLENYRGVGFNKGIPWLLEIKNKYNVDITTDFHSVRNIIDYGGAVDLVQIPAYLCQQTSMLIEAAKYKVHIKKGQFLGPEEFVNGPIDKLKDAGAKEIFATDRGTTHGYNDLFMDPRHIKYMKQPGVKVLADITHPNKNYLGTDRKEAYAIGVSYLAAGADGLFMETHCAPVIGQCDALTMLPIETFDSYIKRFYDLYKFTKDHL